MKRMLSLVFLAGILLAPITVRAASDGDFVACDGYAAPKGKSDGISKGTWLWGLAAQTADIRREATPKLGARGLAACDAALDDPRLLAQFRLRRASLLQGKALHAVASGQPEMALALTEQSDEVGWVDKDPYFARSVGVGNLAVRAYALNVLNRADDARHAIALLRSKRRWSQSVQRLAQRLEALLDPGLDAYRAQLRSAIPLDPGQAKAAFWTEVYARNYEQALAIYPAMDFSLPNMRGSWTLEGEDVADVKLLEERSDAVGAAAYVTATLGRREEALAMIDEFSREVEQVLVPPPPRANGKPPKLAVAVLANRRMYYAERARVKLAQWRKALDFLNDVGGRSLEALQGDITRGELSRLAVFPDLLSRIAAQFPDQKPEIDRVLATSSERMERERIKASMIDPTILVDLLPKSETAGAIPVLKPAGDGYFLTDSGLSREREGSDIWTIRYTHRLAPIAADEELAMFGAAQAAQKQGFDSLLLLSTTAIARTTNVSSYGMASYPTNSGYEAQLRVRFVNAASLPDDAKPEAWRLISVVEVIRDLEARYKSSGGPTIAF